MWREVRLLPIAKLNLDLRVLYRRSDGYHELRTLFQTISLTDRLQIRYRPASTFSAVIDGGDSIPDNLITRAAELCSQELGINGEVRFQLEKRIPIGGGLGGGSSDAAAVLLALPVLADRIAPFATLLRMAARLGSDVPFFLCGGSAIGLGRGEEIYPMPDFPALRGLLVAPGIAVSTPAAYAQLSATLDFARAADAIAGFTQTVWNRNLEALHNDFETVVFSAHPKLKLIQSQLEQLGAVCARMTGSGSAIFGLFSSPETARSARRLLKGSSLEQSRVWPIHLVSRSRYRAAWLRRLQPYAHPQLWPPQSLRAR